MKDIYLDYNSTTPVDDEVVAVTAETMKTLYGNPSSVHTTGGKAKAAMENARERIANILGADVSEIYFTSGGTEADNLAIKGVAYYRQKKGRHIITSNIEHHAILESAHYLEKIGYKVTTIGCDKEGVVDLDELRGAITPETTLVSIMMANNETGVIQPVKEIAAVCKEHEIPFHTDAVQAIGKLPVKVDDIGCDLLSISAHKFYGPKGIGVLYIRKGQRVTPLFHGGFHEKRRRAGTENIPAIIGMARALEIAEEMRESEHARLHDLGSYFIELVQSKIDEVFLNGSFENRIPSTVNLSFKGVEGEAIILSLDLKGIAVSSGSACTSGALMASHVLTGMGVDTLLAQGSIRFSMGRYTTKEDIDYTVSVLPEIIDRLRSMSAAYTKPK